MSLGGEMLPKDHILMECVGTLDELRAHTALLLRQIEREPFPQYEDAVAFLGWLLNVYFIMGTACSDPEKRHPEWQPVPLSSAHVAKLEAEQVRMEKAGVLPKGFVVGASTALAAQADITCTVSRRLERRATGLAREFPAFRDQSIPVFLNRLSDYFFVLARYLEDGRHESVDYGKAADVS